MINQSNTRNDLVLIALAITEMYLTLTPIPPSTHALLL